jgi:Protein of unknown function (DUF3309)
VRNFGSVDGTGGGAPLFFFMRLAEFLRRSSGRNAMSLGTILIILVILYLLGGWSGRIGGYGYGYGHSGMGLGGVVLVVLLVLLLLGKL